MILHACGLSTHPYTPFPPERLIRTLFQPLLNPLSQLLSNFFHLVFIIFTSILHPVLFSIFSSIFIPFIFYFCFTSPHLSSQCVPSLSRSLRQPYFYMTATTGKAWGIHRKRMLHTTRYCNVLQDLNEDNNIIRL